eukprot:2588921-Heterocapsa_arctica.AAC.1
MLAEQTELLMEMSRDWKRSSQDQGDTGQSKEPAAEPKASDVADLSSCDGELCHSQRSDGLKSEDEPKLLADTITQ